MISRELGENAYDKYFYHYQKMIIQKTQTGADIKKELVFQDMYNKLKDNDRDSLILKLERLSEAMYLAVHVSKTYIFVIVFYLGAAAFLISQQLQISITVMSILLMSTCFLYKTYEFVVNKYCFIDAYLILIYKEVLDKLLNVPPIEK